MKLNDPKIGVIIIIFWVFFFGTKKLENFAEFFFCLGKIEIYFYFLTKISKISILLFTKQTLASIPNNNP